MIDGGLISHVEFLSSSTFALKTRGLILSDWFDVVTDSCFDLQLQTDAILHAPVDSSAIGKGNGVM